MSTAPQAILDLVERFEHNIEHYHGLNASISLQVGEWAKRRTLEQLWLAQRR